MSKNETITTCVGFICAMLAIVVPSGLVITNSTERHQLCVEAGGSYVHVPETSYMDCVMPGEDE